jgi:hypothetical protein
MSAQAASGGRLDFLQQLARLLGLALELRHRRFKIGADLLTRLVGLLLKVLELGPPHIGLGA